MKTYEKVLYRKEHNVHIAYGTCEDEPIKTYVEIKMLFDLKCGLYFSVSNSNFCISGHNLIRIVGIALEKLNQGSLRYERIKEDCINKGLWKQLK